MLFTIRNNILPNTDTQINPNSLPVSSNRKPQFTKAPTKKQDLNHRGTQNTISHCFGPVAHQNGDRKKSVPFDTRDFNDARVSRFANGEMLPTWANFLGWNEGGLRSNALPRDGILQRRWRKCAGLRIWVSCVRGSQGCHHDAVERVQHDRSAAGTDQLDVSPLARGRS